MRFPFVTRKSLDEAIRGRDSVIHGLQVALSQQTQKTVDADARAERAEQQAVNLKKDLASVWTVVTETNLEELKKQVTP